MSGNSYPFSVKVTKVYHLNVTAKTQNEAFEAVAALTPRQIAQRGEAVKVIVGMINVI